MRYLSIIFIVAFFCAQGLFGQAKQRCEWVGNPALTITYTPWVVTSPGTFWDTEERTCCTVATGMGIWVTTIKTSSSGVSAGAGVSTTGPSVSVGVSFGCSETVVNTVGPQPASSTQKTKQSKCLFSSEVVINQTLAFSATHNSNECLINGWAGADSVVWDGQTLALNDVIDLSQESLGDHSYIVTRIRGGNVEIYDFTITVVNAIAAQFMGPEVATIPSFPGGPIGTVSLTASTSVIPVPINNGATAAVAFTNTSSFAVDVQFVPYALQAGVDVGLRENQVNLQPNQTVTRIVEFATQPGWVLPEGAVLKARVDVHALGPFGVILGSQEVYATSCLLTSGSGDDYALETSINSGNGEAMCAKPTTAGDTLTIDVFSPNGTLDGSTHTLFGDVFLAGLPLIRIFPTYPELQVSANYFTVIPFTSLATGGLTLSLPIPAGLAGIAVRLQGALLSPNTNNGLFAATNAHDLVIE
jgi:hypothetical protein